MRQRKKPTRREKIAAAQSGEAMAIQDRHGRVPSAQFLPSAQDSFSYQSPPVASPAGSVTFAVPEFNADPALPGRMRLVEVVEEDVAVLDRPALPDSIPSNPSNPPSEQVSEIIDQASLNNQEISMKNANKPAAAETLSFFDTIVEKVIVPAAAKQRASKQLRTKEAQVTPGAEGEEVVQSEVQASLDRIQELERRREAIKRNMGLAGFATGFGGVGAGVYGLVASKRAAELAAAAAAAEAATASALTVGEAVVAGEAAAVATGGGVLGTVTGALTTARTLPLVGLTLPVWGWAAAAAGVGVAGYGVYKLFKSDDEVAPVEPAKEEPTANGKLTVSESMGAFTDGLKVGVTTGISVAGTAALVGVAGTALIGKSVAAFGTQYGPVVAIGGTYVGARAVSNTFDAVRNHYRHKEALARLEKLIATETATIVADSVPTDQS